jgi:hypothetical protein
MWLRGNRKKLTPKELIVIAGTIVKLALLPAFAVALIALVVYGAVQGYNKLNQSDHFLLKNVFIQGETDLTQDEIIGWCGLHLGQDKTLFLKAEEIQAMCERHPRIRTAKVQIELPDSVSLKIQVQKPVFYVANQFGLFEVSQFKEVIRPVPPEDIEPLPVLVLDRKVLPEDVPMAISGMLQILSLLQEKAVLCNEQPPVVEFARAAGFTLACGFKAHLGYPPLDAKMNCLKKVMKIVSQENLPLEEVYIAPSMNANRATVRFSERGSPLVLEKLHGLSARKEGL